MAWPNIVGLAAANATYEENDFIEYSLNRINEGRKIVNGVFRKNGIEPLPSETNFVCADIGRQVSEFGPSYHVRIIGQINSDSFLVFPTHFWNNIFYRKSSKIQCK